MRFSVFFFLVVRNERDLRSTKEKKEATQEKRCFFCPLTPFIFSFELFLYETQRKTYQNYRLLDRLGSFHVRVGNPCLRHSRN